MRTVSAIGAMLLVLARPAPAAEATLAEDEARRTLVQRDEAIALELVGGFTHFITTSQYESDRPDLNTSGVGVEAVHVALHLHVVRALGISLGIAHMSSPTAGIAVVPLQYGGVSGKPGVLSQTGPLMGIEANPIGFGNVQTALGVEMVPASGFVFTYYAGLRIELARLRFYPRVTYTDSRYEHPDYSIGTNYYFGIGFGMQIGYVLGSAKP
jgi:hypothetical protein